MVCALTLLYMIKSLTLNSYVKNMEAEKQVKFFQGCVAAAFAERDHAIIEVMILAAFHFKKIVLTMLCTC